MLTIPILLASQSPYRAAQLKQLGLNFEQKKPNCDEDQFKNLGLDPGDLAVRLSEEKAKSLSPLAEKYLIIAGDQLGHLNGEILGKSGTAEKARAQLKQMQGKTHELLSAVTLLHKERMTTHLVRARLTMRPLSDSAIAAYVRRDNPIDCAGSYKVESLGISLFSEIETKDPSAIVGLPLMAVTETLLSWGYPLFE